MTRRHKAYKRRSNPDPWSKGYVIKMGGVISDKRGNPSQSEITASLLFAWGLGYIVGKGRR